MAYTAEKALSAVKEYLDLKDVMSVPGTNNRGFICEIEQVGCVIFTCPIGCKKENKQNWVDTRDSGVKERKRARKYAKDNNLKYFCLCVNSEQDRYRDYIFSLENTEEFISGISFRKQEGVVGTGTQANIPGWYIPSKKYDRLVTDKGFVFSIIHKSFINEYLHIFDTRTVEKEKINTSKLYLKDPQQTYTVKELGEILKQMYDNAPENKQVASIHVFGVKYGNVIRKEGYKITQIIDASGLNQSYTAELSKGLNEYDLLKDSCYGIGIENGTDSAESDSDLKVEFVYKTGIDIFDFNYNRILFGAPGTGKSFTLNNDKDILLSGGGEYERVTFHPDYSYANFVGTYKPISKNGEIVYKFVPGPFMKTLVKALRSGQTDTPQPYLLLIEEINRANVAAVFGDVFQLLDRKDGVSEYPIQTSEDVKDYLSSELGGEPSDYETIKLPDNMLIWATMNSADQGVFPMDTAFKRRWDFTYLGINDAENDIIDKVVRLPGEENSIAWNSIRKGINSKMVALKINEDKQLGPYFINVDNIIEDEETNELNADEFIRIFKNKVLMYLFEDAVKQRRSDIFGGCEDSHRQVYSEICKEFDAKGIDIFSSDITNAIEEYENQRGEK